MAVNEKTGIHSEEIGTEHPNQNLGEKNSRAISDILNQTSSELTDKDIKGEYRELLIQIFDIKTLRLRQKTINNLVFENKEIDKASIKIEVFMSECEIIANNIGQNNKKLNLNIYWKKKKIQFLIFFSTLIGYPLSEMEGVINRESDDYENKYEECMNERKINLKKIKNKHNTVPENLESIRAETIKITKIKNILEYLIKKYKKDELIQALKNIERFLKSIDKYINITYTLWDDMV